jgi:hypothetical protein
LGTGTELLEDRCLSPNPESEGSNSDARAVLFGIHMNDRQLPLVQDEMIRARRSYFTRWLLICEQPVDLGNRTGLGL